MVVPSSPLHQKPTLGLDLQGGLEITKQAVPPKGRRLTKEDLTARSGSCATVSTASASPSRRSARRARIRSRSRCPGIKDPEAAAKIIGKTAQLELFDLEANLAPPSIDASRFPVAKSSVYDLLAGQQALALKGAPDQYYLFDKKKKLVAGPVATQGPRRCASSTARFRRATSCSRCRPERSSSPAASARSSARASSRRTRRRTRTTCSSTPRRRSRR